MYFFVVKTKISEIKNYTRIKKKVINGDAPVMQSTSLPDGKSKV